MNRRSFLARAAGLLGAAPLASRTLQAPTPAPEPPKTFATGGPVRGASVMYADVREAIVPLAHHEYRLVSIAPDFKNPIRLA